MSTPARVLAFAAGLAAVFALAFGVGRVVPPPTTPVADHEADSHGGGHAEHPATAAPAEVHLALGQRMPAPGPSVPLSFQVQDQDGRAVTSYDVEHEKQLHLIVLDTRTLTDFQHVHPTLGADGTWTVRVALQPGTSYRMYADGSTGGHGFLATADLATTGSRPAPGPAPGPVPAPSTTDHVAGMTVTLDQANDTVRPTVTRDGRPVTLQPYLGALGHLVVIRVDDLSYLHVHPEAGAAPTFMVAGLAPGRYRYFFDFQVDGVVHTAAFTHDVGPSMPMGTEEHDDDNH